MAKVRKTREEKIATRARQQAYLSYSLQGLSSISPLKHSFVHHTTAYTHVVNDLRKTFFTSLSLLLLQIILFFLLQHRVFTIPGVS